MKKAIAILAVALFGAGVAYAASAPQTKTTNVATAEMHTAQALDAGESAADRTITITIRKYWSKLRLGVAYTYGAGTSLTLTPTCAYKASGTHYGLSTRSCSSGACELAPLTDVETGTASWTREVEYDVRGCHELKVLFAAGGSPTSSDVVTTEAIAIVGD